MLAGRAEKMFRYHCRFITIKKTNIIVNLVLKKINMATSKITYNGGLRTTSIHERSGDEIITDAPLDNKGKGEAFSPTDLLATSLGNCMLTIVGIAAAEHGFTIDGATCEITKIMAEQPRRVSEIIANFQFPSNAYTEKDKKIIERAANTCPVFYSLHPDIKKTVTFNY